MSDGIVIVLLKDRSRQLSVCVCVWFSQFNQSLPRAQYQ